jgi:hypothetical protein
MFFPESEHKTSNFGVGSLPILAYFPKMKVGLSNHQSVYVCAPPLTTSCTTNSFFYVTVHSFDVK